MLVRMRRDELFSETFACGEDNLSVVTFVVHEDARILFMPFDEVMHTCNMTCMFHHQLIENMVHIIARKNRDLMRKVEVIPKRILQENILAYLSIQAQIHKSRMGEDFVKWADKESIIKIILNTYNYVKEHIDPNAPGGKKHIGYIVDRTGFEEFRRRALAEAFGCGVNDLPLSMVLSWYKQKAVCILLTLLYLGIKNIRLGPTLPAFISPKVLSFLIEKFNIAPVTTPGEDLKAIPG